MATPVGQLTIEMAANIVRLQKDMDAARKTVDGAMSSITKTVDTAMRAVGTLFAGVSIVAFTNKLVSVQREFDVLSSSLITVTGSAQAADKAFAFLEDFASTTPFSLAEVTQAFTKLKALGLDPSESALRSYGNTASAMGKSLNQMIEAVADAATGEFERLKEFGIKASSEGDRVTMTFRGLSTTIGKNAVEIENYLRRIGDVDFAGATELRAKTLDGALSNLGDTFDKLMRTIYQGDVGGVISESVRLATASLEALIKIVEALNTTLRNAGQESTTFSVILSGITTIFETVAVVGVNVKYVITQIINEIVGLSKQVQAITTLDFEAVERIGDQMKAEAEQARRQVDFTTQAILSARSAQSMSLKETENDLERLGNRWISTGSAAADAYAKELAEARKTKPVVIALTKEQLKEMEKQEQAYKKLLNDINDRTGAMILERQQTEKLTDGQKLALKVMQDIQTETIKLNNGQKIRITQSLEELLATEKVNQEMQDLAKTQQATATLSSKLNDEQWKNVDSLRNTVISLTEQNLELRDGKKAVAERQVAIMRATAADLEWTAANEGGNAALEEQARLLRQQADLTENNALLTAAKEARQEWEKTSEKIGESLTDSLLRAFESGKDFGKAMADTLVNLFKTLVLKPIIQPIAQGGANILLSAMGMALPGAASAGGGTTSGIGSAGNFTSVLTAMGGHFGTGFMNTLIGTGGGASMTAAQSLYASGSYGQAAGMAAGSLAAYGAGAAVGVYGGRAISGGYAISGSGNGLVNAGTAIGMVVGGPIGAAIGGAIAGGINRMFGRKQTDIGIEGTLTTAEGIDGQSYRFMKGGIFRSNKTIREELSSEVEMLFDSSIELITKQTRNYAAALGLPAAAIDSFTQQIKLSFQGLSEEEINQKIADTLAEFQEGLASQYASALEPLQIAGETFTETLQRLIAIQDVSIVLNEFGGAFSTFATASITARQGIIELAGGLDALIQKTQGFVANFYSKEEQAGITARGIVVALEDAGFTASQIAALETRSDFRTLLESIDISTEIGQKQFVTLLDLQAAYAQTVPMMEEQGVTLMAIAEAAPQIEMLQKMFETDAEYQSRVQTAEEMAQSTFDSILETMGQVDLSINSLTTIMAGKLDRLSAEMAAAQAEANAAAASAIAVANAAAEAAIVAAQAAAAEAAAAAAQGLEYGTAAVGGYIGGPTLVGEHGPEIFDPMRSQIYTAPATADMLGNGEVAAEIRALRDEVAMMRYETRSTAVNTAKIARLQDNWDVRGLTVKTDADQPLDTVAV